MNTRNDLPVSTGADAERMLHGLRNPACYPHPVQRIELLETHISWAILTGSYAYKIKRCDALAQRLNGNRLYGQT